MKVVIAPDSFKSSLNSQAATECIVKGIKRVDAAIQTAAIPIADGGEGTVKNLVAALSGRIFEARVRGPLGEDVPGFYGILNDGETAVLEIAAASGIELYKNSIPDPFRASTYGTGQLIREILSKGCRRLIIGLGGSATNDGGAGIAQALGARFFDAFEHELPLGGKALLDLKRIDISGMPPALHGIEVIAACDVTNPLCGPNGASAIYGRQKGATPGMIAVLDRALENYASVIKKDLDLDVAEIPGAGAAGGTGAGLVAFCQASLKPGIDIICDLVDFERQIRDADLIITGEGKIDGQTCQGKAVYGLAKRAKKYNVPIIVLTGSVDTASIENFYAMGITAIFNINPTLTHLSEAISRTSENIEFTVSQLTRLITRFDHSQGKKNTGEKRGVADGC